MVLGQCLFVIKVADLRLGVVAGAHSSAVDDPDSGVSVKETSNGQRPGRDETVRTAQRAGGRCCQWMSFPTIPRAVRRRVPIVVRSARVFEVARGSSPALQLTVQRLTTPACLGEPLDHAESRRNLSATRLRDR